jgi:hypothetical protein
LHPESVCVVYNVKLTDVAKVEPIFELLHPLFCWAPVDTIQCTFDVTTQFARGRVSDTPKQDCRSRFPACNVKHCNEPVATDTILCDIPAVHSDVTSAKILVTESLVADVYGLKTDTEFVNTLEENIQEQRAMYKLISNCAKAENSNCVKQILCALCISSWFS